MLPGIHGTLDWLGTHPEVVSACGVVASSLAAVAAVGVAVWPALSTRRIARQQLDLQARRQRMDLFNRGFKAFEATGEFLRPILASPSGFNANSEPYWRFPEIALTGTFLFGTEVCRYLSALKAAALDLSTQRVRLSNGQGDILAIDAFDTAFRRLNELWKQRREICRGEMNLA